MTEQVVYKNDQRLPLQTLKRSTAGSMSMPPGMLILGATVTLRLLKRRSLTGHLLLRLFSLALGAGACRDRAEALDYKVENADSPGCSRLPKRHVLETEARKACFTLWICTHI